MRDLTGQRFGRLVALECVGSSPSKRRLWNCVCDCGNTKVVSSGSLIQGNTKSCGCLQKEMRVKANIKHGDSRKRLYRIWKGMISRCECKSSTDYKWYGAKGVKVCDEWHDYITFKTWAESNGYNEKLTIDRINPHMNYCPDNCRWATTEEQNKNRRCNSET